MNFHNKLFKTILGRDGRYDRYDEIYRDFEYLYFTRNGFYEFRTRAIHEASSRLVYISRREVYNRRYEIWVKGIKSFFETGVDTDSPDWSYRETPLAILLTSKHKGWRDFARKRLLK